MSTHQFRMFVLLIATTLIVGPGWLTGQVLQAQAPEPEQAADLWASQILGGKFAEVQKLIKPQPGESRWMEIPWQTSLWEARRLAASAGKPLFVWYGSGGGCALPVGPEAPPRT